MENLPLEQRDYPLEPHVSQRCVVANGKMYQSCFICGAYNEATKMIYRNNQMLCLRCESYQLAKLEELNRYRNGR